MQYALIDQTGLVVNVIEWDGVNSWQPPSDHIVVPLEFGGIGWIYRDNSFIES